MFSALVGLITDTVKQPVAHAIGTITELHGGGIRSTVSSGDGVFSFADLPPGIWSIKSQAPGYPDVIVSEQRVTAGEATRRDIVMSAAAAPPASWPRTSRR